MAEEVCLPPDFSRLLEVNAPDMELHEFAREMQTLDVLLWHFIALVDDREQGLGLTTVGGSCGYVSAADGTSAATARVL